MEFPPLLLQEDAIVTPVEVQGEKQDSGFGIQGADKPEGNSDFSGQINRTGRGDTRAASQGSGFRDLILNPDS
jgi:hypothetical protein